jgi:hypothetical protein
VCVFSSDRVWWSPSGRTMPLTGHRMITRRSSSHLPRRSMCNPPHRLLPSRLLHHPSGTIVRIRRATTRTCNSALADGDRSLRPRNKARSHVLLLRCLPGTAGGSGPRGCAAQAPGQALSLQAYRVGHVCRLALLCSMPYRFGSRSMGPDGGGGGSPGGGGGGSPGGGGGGAERCTGAVATPGT